MAKVFTILLSVIMLVQSSSKVLLWVGYELNKKYIIENLCENRSKPQMHCNGKCHLAKEFSKEEKKEKSPANLLKEESEITLFSANTFVTAPALFTEKNEYSIFYLLTTHTAFLKSVEHPPCC